MKVLRSHPRSALAGAGLALALFAMTSMTGPAPPQEAAAAPACFSFTTIAKGQHSGFGDFCGGTGGYTPDDTACLQADTAPPCFACVAQPEFEAIIRNECAWTDLWTQHTSNVWPPPPVPSVDFDKFVVVAVISGTRPDGCFEIEITKITGSSSPCANRTIHVRERVPCPKGEACPDVLTNNFHFIKVCKDFLPFKIPTCFEHRLSSPKCSPQVACLGTGG